MATGLGAASFDTASGPVTRAVLGYSPASVVGTTAATSLPPSSPPPSRLPDPATVVDVTGSGRLAGPGLTAGDIPPAAWQAYLNAATVLAKAAPRCGLDWTALAAIGLVESDHGRNPSRAVSSTGVRAARDTDGGRLDGDATADLPVGPMRILPSTWQVIGVDGDGDGVRSPADADDAALAVGVALCAGDARLGSTAGLRRALLRYAPSPAYVDLVIGIARSYARPGTGVPTATVTAVAHPIVDGTRTTLARRSLAHRVRAAGSVTAKTVGIDSSPSAHALSVAATSAAPPAGAGPQATTTHLPVQEPATETTAAAPTVSGSPAQAPTDPAPADPASTPAGRAEPTDPEPTDAEAPGGGTAESPAAACRVPDPGPEDPDGDPATAADPAAEAQPDPAADSSAMDAADAPAPSDPSAQPAPCTDAPAADALSASATPRTTDAPSAANPPTATEPPAADEAISPPSPSSPAAR